MIDNGILNSILLLLLNVIAGFIVRALHGLGRRMDKMEGMLVRHLEWHASQQ